MGVCDWRECVAIGGVCGDWGSLWRLGEFVVIGGVCGDWESLWRLGEFVVIGGVCGDWGSLWRLGEFGDWCSSYAISQYPTSFTNDY